MKPSLKSYRESRPLRRALDRTAASIDRLHAKVLNWHIDEWYRGFLADRQAGIERKSFDLDTSDGTAYGTMLANHGAGLYDEQAFSIRFKFASSRGRDRENDFLHVNGIDTSRHRQNPVVF